MSQLETGQSWHVDGDDGDLGDVASYQLVVSQVEAAWHVGDDDDGVGDDGDDSHQLVVSQIEAGQGGDVDGAGRQGGEHVVAEVDLQVIHGHEITMMMLALWVLMIVMILLTLRSIFNIQYELNLN